MTIDLGLGRWAQNSLHQPSTTRHQVLATLQWYLSYYRLGLLHNRTIGGFIFICCAESGLSFFITYFLIYDRISRATSGTSTKMTRLLWHQTLAGLLLLWLRSPGANAVASDHYACGSSWNDVQTKCAAGTATHCPNGVNSDCAVNEYCYADTQCNFAGPTPAPAPTPAPPPTNPGTAGNDSRLVAFLGNWHACPSDAEIAPYTDIVVSFAVTYQGSGANSANCVIGSPVMICGSQNRQVCF